MNIPAHILFADYIIDCAKYALGFIFAQIIEQISVHENTGEVCNALDGRNVIFTLTCHCLTQMIEVAADCTHCVTFSLQVVGVGLQCLGFHLGDGFFQSQAGVAESRHIICVIAGPSAHDNVLGIGEHAAFALFIAHILP